MSYVKKTLVSVMALAMLAGCSSSSAAATTASSSGASNATVKVAIDADLNTMDYHIATDGNSFIMQSMCMSGLTELDAKGVAQPELAKSWDVSSDGLKYTFHLADAKWSNW
jgi:oligopeptide transport system substrate-binding protein